MSLTDRLSDSVDRYLKARVNYWIDWEVLLMNIIRSMATMEEKEYVMLRIENIENEVSIMKDWKDALDCLKVMDDDMRSTIVRPEEIINITNGRCFKNYFNKIARFRGHKFEKEYFRIVDFSANEQIWLLNQFTDDKVYISIYPKDKKNNHISSEPFLNCKQIKFYQLFLIEYRYCMFFSSSAKKENRTVSFNSSKEDGGIKIVLEKRNLEIKSLKEEVYILKSQVDENKCRVSNVKVLSVMLQDIKIADSFVKAVMKEEFLNFIELSDQTIDEVIESKLKTPKKVKTRRHDSFNADFNQKDCGCDKCMLNRNMRDTALAPFIRTDKRKEFMLTTKISVNMDFNSKEFNLLHDNSSKNEKKLVILNKKTNETVVKIIFGEIKSKIFNKNSNFNFSSNRIFPMDFTREGFDMMKMVSHSSVIVVQSMRALKEKSYTLFSKGEFKTEKSGCFARMVTEVTGIDYNMACDKILCISDLMFEEEVHFLSCTEDKKVYIRMNSTEDIDYQNHISMSNFEGAVEMDLNLMVTPMFRDVLFFTTRVKMDFTTMSSTDGGSPISSKIRDSIKLDSLIPETHDNFVSVQFTNQFKNKGVSDEVLFQLMESRLTYSQVMSTSESIIPMRLYYMEKREFKAICFFSGSIAIFSKMVLHSDLTKWFQTLNVLPKMVMEKYIPQTTHLDEVVEYSKFLNNMDDLGSLDNPIMDKLFYMFKNRIFNLIVMESLSKEMDKVNRTVYKNMNSLDHMITDKKNMRWVDEYNRVSNEIDNDMMIEISKFQPNSKTRERIKKIERDLKSMESEMLGVEIMNSDNSILEKMIKEF